ncbi:MAG TPA: IS66 family transposase, partial [Isosphaeraceae bacterium]|nr:IS66 family transposase [Isosphaeraceae bacterium]
LRAQLDQRARAAKRQAAPFSKGQRKALPKRPGRKPGQGRFTFRTLPRPDQWTAPPIEGRLPDPVCPCCGEALHEHRVDFAAVTDIPPQPKPIVQPYRVWVYRCPTCDTTVRAPHPDLAPDQYGATAHRLGPRVRAAAHATHYGLGVPVRKVPAVLRLFTGVSVTQSALTQDALRRVSGSIGRMYQTLRDQIPKAEVVYTDDTGWRVGGDPAQLMIFVTDTATVFQVRAQHRNEEDREVIGDAYPGVLVTDRGKSYDAKELEAVKQQKCINHALRSINEVLETKQGRARHFGARLKKLLKEGLQLWHEYHDHRGQLAGFERRTRSLQEAVTRHLKPRRLVDADNQRLLDQFGRHHTKGNLLRFLDDPRIEPTNNHSERGFRFAVIQRKVSQCSKTEGGAQAFSAFASVIKTAMKQGKNVVDWLSALFRGVDPQSAPT